MSKKNLYYEDAERLYVRERRTPDEIAGQLSLSEKTVRNWKDEGRWEEKRAAYLKSCQSTFEDIVELTRLLARSLLDDLRAGRKIDQGRLYTLTALLPKAMKAKELEDIAAKADPKEIKATGMDIARLIEEQLMGGAPAAPAQPAAPAAGQPPTPQQDAK